MVRCTQAATEHPAEPHLWSPRITHRGQVLVHAVKQRVYCQESSKHRQQLLLTQLIPRLACACMHTCIQDWLLIRSCCVLRKWHIAGAEVQ